MILSNIADNDRVCPLHSIPAPVRRRNINARRFIISLAVLAALFSTIPTNLFAQTAPAPAPAAAPTPAAAAAQATAATSMPAQPGTSQSPVSVSPSFSTLPNGMDLILLPLPESKTVSMNIVFRGGADVQTSKNAGLFRLLEHILFRGTAVSPGQPEPAGATEALDASYIGGGAAADRFGLSFVFAPAVLTQGLDTIVYLFSGLRLETAFSDPLALEEARNASLSEIDQEFSDPSTVYDSALAKKLFVSAPWRLDVTGADYILNGATEDSLRSLASTWLAPNNAALIIAGNFPPETIAPMIEKAFSSWKKAQDPWKSPPSAFPKPGITRPTLMAYPDPTIAPGEAVVEMRYRGPDSASSRAAAGTLWAEMASRPDGRLALAIRKGMPKWSAPSSIDVHYELSKSSSWFSVSAHLTLDSKANLADSVMTFKEIVRGTEMYAMKTNSGYFTAKEYEQAKYSLSEKRTEKLSDSKEAGVLIADGWILGGKAWIESWADKIGKISSKDITAFADEYFMKNLEIISIRLSPNDYASRKKSFDAYGFELITPQKAFWWR
jgi:predicted Zn-dependent peptidase